MAARISRQLTGTQQTTVPCSDERDCTKLAGPAGGAKHPQAQIKCQSGVHRNRALACEIKLGHVVDPATPVN